MCDAIVGNWDQWGNSIHSINIILVQICLLGVNNQLAFHKYVYDFLCSVIFNKATS